MKWFNEAIAKRHFRATCGPSVEVVGVSISRPEVREITARYIIRGEDGVERFVAAWCGGGATQLPRRCEELGRIAAKRAEEVHEQA